MPKQFIIFSEEDMKKLSEERPVHMDATKDFPAITFFTEEGYKKFLEFWDEAEDAN
mgnify:CR=1 FL=1